MVEITPAAVVEFWRDAGDKQWFARNAGFEAEIRERFVDAHFAAAQRELEHWMDGAESALALLLLLDQFPRNLFRRSAHAYATDPLARHYASRAIDKGFDVQADPGLRVFFYLPFEHSEAIGDQLRSLELTRPLDESFRKYAIAHHEVIQRFGRFPHRNRELGRVSTPEEQQYLDAGDGFAG